MGSKRVANPLMAPDTLEAGRADTPAGLHTGHSEPPVDFRPMARRRRRPSPLIYGTQYSPLERAIRAQMTAQMHSLILGGGGQTTELKESTIPLTAEATTARSTSLASAVRNPTLRGIAIAIAIDLQFPQPSPHGR